MPRRVDPTIKNAGQERAKLKQYKLKTPLPSLAAQMLKFSKLSVTFFFGVLSWSERDELQANPEATLVASATEEDVSQYNQLQQLGNVAPQMPSHAIEDLLSIGVRSLVFEPFT